LLLEIEEAIRRIERRFTNIDLLIHPLTLPATTKGSIASMALA
jgi:hypothetical protein